MTCQCGSRSRTSAASRSHRDASQAHGQIGSNQKSTRVLTDHPNRSVPFDVPRVTDSETSSHRTPLPTKPPERPVTANNLTRDEARERARLVSGVSYDVALDLTDGAGSPGEEVFRSETVARFSCREP